MTTRQHVKQRYKDNNVTKRKKSTEEGDAKNKLGQSQLNNSTYNSSQRPSTVMNAFPGGGTPENAEDPDKYYNQTDVANDLQKIGQGAPSPKYTNLKEIKNQEVRDYIEQQKKFCSKIARILTGKGTKVSQAELRKRFPDD